MIGLGSGNNGELTFLDIISLISFVVGLQNLELNITQNDIQEQTNEINDTADKRVNRLLSEIHSHLEAQDKKIDDIWRYIHENHQKTE